MKALDIAGLVDISGLTSNANCTSDGTTATPTASLTLGQVTVEGAKAFIDNKGVHIVGLSTGALGVTPATLQKSLDATLAADGISIRVLDPVLTTNGAAGTANAGGLVVSLAHQFDVPFIPGEPTIPVPELGNVGLPAGLYTMTTSITFGMAQVDVSATGIPAATGTGSTGAVGPVGGLASAEPFDNGSGLTTFGGTPGTVESVATTGPGSATSNPSDPDPDVGDRLPHPGHPRPARLAHHRAGGLHTARLSVAAAGEVAVPGWKETIMLEMERPVRDSVGVAPDQDLAAPATANGQTPAESLGDRFRRLLPRGLGGGGGAKPVRADGEDSGSYDLRNAWQVVAGSILIPLGVVFILLGWYGSAHARVVQQQIPYMVSGAFIGLGCMVVGGLLYWGHWLYRLYDQKELHHEEELKVLHDLVNTLTAQGVGGGAHSAAASDLPADR